MLADIGRFTRPYLISGEAKRRESTGHDIIQSLGQCVSVNSLMRVDLNIAPSHPHYLRKKWFDELLISFPVTPE